MSEGRNVNNLRQEARRKAEAALGGQCGTSGCGAVTGLQIYYKPGVPHKKTMQQKLALAKAHPELFDLICEKHREFVVPEEPETESEVSDMTWDAESGTYRDSYGR